MIKFKTKDKTFSAPSKIIKGIKGAKKAINDTAWKMRLNPERTIKEGMAKVAENPISASSQVLASPVAMAASNAVGGPVLAASVGAFPHSTYWIGGERLLKKNFPKYDKITQKAGKKVRESKTLDSVLGKEPKVNFKNAGPKADLSEKIKYNLRSGISDISNGVKAAGKSIAKMASFSSSKQKNYTIQEGHYTGPKDMEEVPGTIEVLGKATLGGSGVGALTGSLLKNLGNVESTGLFDGAKKGGKIGFLSGIVLKALLNHLHKPMSKVKYQEVDKYLRREFGIYRVAGITVGDSREKRKSFDEKFGTNDREVTKYPINICINNNKVNMYTLNLSDDALDKLNKSLDYYCKKFSGMEYSSRVINARTNTYSVCIVFTNYEAISSFILEISEILGIKINLLDSDILPETKIGKSESFDADESRVYSNIPIFSKYDLYQIFSKSGALGITALALSGPKNGFNLLVNQTLESAIKKIGTKEFIKIVGGKRKEFDTNFILGELKKLGYTEGFHYTVGEEGSDINISMVVGQVIITTSIRSKADLLMEKVLKGINYKKTEVNKKVNLWTFSIEDKNSFDIFLKILIGYVKPNIYI